MKRWEIKMKQISEREYNKLRECLKLMRNDKVANEIGERVIDLYQVCETLEIAEVFRHVLRVNQLDESIADGLEEDKKPFLKLPASARYKLLSSKKEFSLTSLQDMKNQERRKGNLEAEEVVVYTRNNDKDIFQTRVYAYSVEAICWHNGERYELCHKESAELTETYVHLMLKYDKNEDFKLGFSNYLARVEAIEKEGISEKYTELRKKYFAEQE